MSINLMKSVIYQILRSMTNIYYTPCWYQKSSFWHHRLESQLKVAEALSFFFDSRAASANGESLSDCS